MTGDRPNDQPSSNRIRVATAIIIAGLTAGVVGGLISLINAQIEMWTMGRRYFPDPAGVTGVPTWRRLAAPVIGGLIAGLIWHKIRADGPIVSIRRAADDEHPKRLTPAIVWDAFAQMIVVGTGTSLGREPAPRQVAGYLGQWISDKLRLSPQTRHTIIATAAAAGLAAVYNVPIAGALYALEIVLRPNLRTHRGWIQVLIAVVVSALATAISWLFSHNRPIYRLPHATASLHQVPWLLLVGVVALAAGAVLSLAIKTAKSHTPSAQKAWWSVPAGSALVALIALVVPQVPGNGQIIVQATLETPLLISALALMAFGKTVATLLAFRTGAAGGILTPSLAVGACLGSMIAILVGCQTPAEVAVFAVTGAAGVLSITQEAPLFAIAFILELVKGPTFLIPAAVVGMIITWPGYRTGRWFLTHWQAAHQNRTKEQPPPRT